MNRLTTPDWLAVGLTVIAGALAVAFVRYDGLGSFADDGVSYMVMARYLAPYLSHVPAIDAAFLDQPYPPLFPLLLVATGGAADYVRAHVVVAACFVAAALLIYAWAKQTLNSGWYALAALALFAASPGAWINMLGILSENLYLALSLAVLGYYGSRFNEPHPRPGQAVLLGVLLGLTILTRTVGVSLLAAYVVSTVLRRGRRAPVRWLPVVVAVLPVAAWYFWRPAAGPYAYTLDLLHLATTVFGGNDAAGGLGGWIAPQLTLLPQVWLTALMIYWRENTDPAVLIAAAWGLLALYGLFSRLERNRMDAWYVLFHLLILLVWPYPGQFNRFVYGLLPLLLVYGIATLFDIERVIGTTVRRHLIPATALAAALAIVLPTATFLAGRAGYRTKIPGMDFTRVADFYRKPDLALAERLALRHEALRQDMDRIRDSTEPDAVVMWYKPDYLALLAGRRSVAYPAARDASALYREIARAAPDYLFLSRLHPRDTRESTDGLAPLALLDAIGRPVWLNRGPDGKELLSVLLRVDRPALSGIVNR